MGDGTIKKKIEDLKERILIPGQHMGTLTNSCGLCRASVYSKTGVEKKLQLNGKVSHPRFHSVSSPSGFIYTAQTLRSGTVQLLRGAHNALCVHLAKGKQLTAVYK